MVMADVSAPGGVQLQDGFSECGDVTMPALFALSYVDQADQDAVYRQLKAMPARTGVPPLRRWTWLRTAAPGALDD